MAGQRPLPPSPSVSAPEAAKPEPASPRAADEPIAKRRRVSDQPEADASRAAARTGSGFDGTAEEEAQARGGEAATREAATREAAATAGDGERVEQGGVSEAGRWDEGRPGRVGSGFELDDASHQRGREAEAKVEGVVKNFDAKESGRSSDEDDEGWGGHMVRPRFVADRSAGPKVSPCEAAVQKNSPPPAIGELGADECGAGPSNRSGAVGGAPAGSDNDGKVGSEAGKADDEDLEDEDVDDEDLMAFLPGGGGEAELPPDVVAKIPPQYRHTAKRIELVRTHVRVETGEELRMDLASKETKGFVDATFECGFKQQLQRAVHAEVRAAKKRKGGRRRRAAKAACKLSKDLKW